MAKNISLLGATFTGVTGVTLPQQGGGTVTFPEVSPTTATDSDVASGKIYFKSDGTQSTGTSSGGGSVVVVDTTDSHGGTIREITASNLIPTQAAQTIHPSTSDQTIASGKYLAGTQTIEAVTYSSTLTAANILSGVVVKVGSATDDDCIVSVTGTASGGGGKNVQVHQSTTRATSSTYTSVNSLTCSKTAKYTVYWSTMRSSTSGTSGSQLYIGGTAYGTADTTTWTNHVQNMKLTGVQINTNQTVAVYARSRGSNYYSYAPLLIIIEE